MRILPAQIPGSSTSSRQFERMAVDLGALLGERRAMRVALERAHREVLVRLCRATAYRDDDTSVHIERIGFLSAHLARLAGRPRDFCRMLRDAAPMHDIGKIGIPDSVLKKPGPLTHDEWIVMKQHPMIGAAMLANSGIPLLDLAASIALTHHERFDGCGYPAGLAGTDIPIEGRIVALVDYFDALTMDRVYRPAQPLEQVLASIAQERGRRFDPALVDAFLPAIEQFITIKRSVDRIAEDSGELSSRSGKP
ncbi:MAG: HD domain-containing protein [Burkholderiaceae bacterium]|nr:HD domain-containing protein [Burkholderiaceae bacterium]